LYFESSTGFQLFYQFIYPLQFWEVGKSGLEIIYAVSRVQRNNSQCAVCFYYCCELCASWMRVVHFYLQHPLYPWRNYHEETKVDVVISPILHTSFRDSCFTYMQWFLNHTAVPFSK
jgi:hypothetical protein